MNAQIIDLLTFALKNSGIDLDEIFRMLAEQTSEIARARGGSDTVKIISHYEDLMDQQKSLLHSICLHIISYGDRVPEGLKEFAEDIMSLSETGSDRVYRLKEVEPDEGEAKS